MQSKERGAEGEDAERRTRADEKSVQRSLQLVIRVQSRTDCWGGEEREKESRVQGDGQSRERREDRRKEGREGGRRLRRVRMLRFKLIGRTPPTSP